MLVTEYREWGPGEMGSWEQIRNTSSLPPLSIQTFCIQKSFQLLFSGSWTVARIPGQVQPPRYRPGPWAAAVPLAAAQGGNQAWGSEAVLSAALLSRYPPKLIVSKRAISPQFGPSSPPGEHGPQPC